MKKNIYKIAIMAIVAMTLMAGSALADTIADKLEFGTHAGSVKWVGMAKEGAYSDSVEDWVYRNDNGDIWAMTVQEYLYPDGSPTGTYGGWLSSTGVFDGFIPGSTWIPYDKTDGFPRMIGMEFKDFDTSDILTNIHMFNTMAGELELLGTSEGFRFFTESFFIDGDNPFVDTPTRISFNMYGIVDYNFGEEIWDATYTISFTNDHPEDPSNWSWHIDVDVYERPPEVPEPGTLLLLGTGLLGAAITARRKIKK